ncbi:MAG TPA: alpha-1,4-glucan--maltose-1-phosphate maltosyltransferase [Terriglobia bacterium]|nr:alpha-1,4-glucan--maltose-1-phosphate maltosyltransferase [Terriglobia bacterium]
MGKKLAKPKSQTPAAPSRVIITHVHPEIEGGRFPAKRVEGDIVAVTADIFTDGHDLISAVLLSRRQGESAWTESPMRGLVNDAWTGSFAVREQGIYEYTLQGWVDHFKSWQRNLAKKAEARQDVLTDLKIGAQLLEDGSRRAASEGAAAAAQKLNEWASLLRGSQSATASSGGGPAIDAAAATELALSGEVTALMAQYPDKRLAAVYDPVLQVVVDRARAGFSAWYEMFPRSWSSEPGKHGAFRDCEAHLPYIAAMGFDVLYLPPIHPIGHTYRKGKNNSPVAGPDDVGSPWAIGSEEGGHKALHPQLGRFEDLERLIARARDHGLEIALDIAYQCSPDHPYAKTHPEWFLHRPDGSIQYAENPPKKYQDIYPLNFESEHWQSLWEELKSVVLFWIGKGVRIFRVDNPHTKPFAFWEWLIREIKAEYPEVIFLAEAFTRPKVMQQLAKLGFSQSYTYFAWRNTTQELTEYFTELTRSEMAEYFRPNLWPNTPDILTEYLQSGGRPAFMARLVLAATLGANYGIYGPAFELCENKPLAPGMEEYLNAEKYEIRSWDLSRSDSLKELIARVNRARKENPALQSNSNLLFHKLDNDQLIAYSKMTADRSNVVLVVVNLDPRWAQSGWVNLPLEDLGLSPYIPFEIHDLLTGARYTWRGPRNYVRLDPNAIPAHLFRVGRPRSG